MLFNDSMQNTIIIIICCKRIIVFGSRYFLRNIFHKIGLSIHSARHLLDDRREPASPSRSTPTDKEVKEI